jgi:tetratricopeptide (TPR) repeat protein
MKLLMLLARTSPLMFTSLLLVSCQMLSDDNKSKTLADLPAASVPDIKSTVAIVDKQKIEISYQKALAAAEDPVLRQQIMARIADFEMARSEENQLSANDGGHYFEKPIALYRELIAVQEKSGQPVKGVELDQLRYKLAKALSMDARGDEAASALDQLAATAPASTYMGETQFRRAEKAFADGDYVAAEKHYKSVADDKSNPLQQNALYMQGWAEFKRADYDKALQSFAKVADQLLTLAKKPEQVAQAVEQLSGAQKNMMEDTFHVMSLSFSYLEGAQSIIDLQKEMGDRVYEHLLYENLGQLYLEKKRFSDSADTYKNFVENNPLSDFSPEFSIKMISVYEQGNFPSLILPAKQEYAQRYGISSSYWTQRNGAIGVKALNYLHKSLQELAEFEHAQAQELSATQLAAANSSDAKAAFSRAANWYREFVATFPKDPKNPEMTFLLAESLSESGDYPQAISAYEKVAYEYQDKARGADSGYSIVLLANEMATSQALAETQKAAWLERKTNYALRFAQGYPADTRAAVVLTQAAQELLTQKRYAEAATVAEEIINLKPPAEAKLQFTAWLVLGHSNFDEKNYAGAEKAYWQVLHLLPAHTQTPGAPSAQEMRERIAASIYQQAQSDLALSQKDEAIKKLLRIADVAPDTDIAIKGRYDAGVYLIEQQKWADAEQVYLNFRQQYPKHELTASIPAKMVLIYQNQSKWALAANELSIMERSSNDPNVKRQSLAMGAELYEKSGNKAMAIEQYQRYANEYPRPVAEAMEAEFQLAKLYGELQDTKKRQYWLQRMIDANASAGTQQNDRTQYLAASATNELADIPYKDFASTPLTLPLKQSLQRKRTALEKALKAQESVLSFGVAEFTTQASYRIGDIYAQLSRDLMKSERPKNLDADALEQYDLLLEEQAFPFEEKAIQIHQANAQRANKGIYDQWVKRSFEELAKLLPARYKKVESTLEVSNEIQ